MSRGRPKKVRIVKKELRIRQFSPRGRPGRPGNMTLKYEEAEAIRLADYLGLNQKESANFMGVSQQTFSRVLKSGRKSLAEALIKGDVIRIEGGTFRLET
jgi:predicted DNA-binding protein (UPF0251 family)